MTEFRSRAMRSFVELHERELRDPLVILPRFLEDERLRTIPACPVGGGGLDAKVP
jgi:hypothetical protein